MIESWRYIVSFVIGWHIYLTLSNPFRVLYHCWNDWEYGKMGEVRSSFPLYTLASSTIPKPRFILRSTRADLSSSQGWQFSSNSTKKRWKAPPLHRPLRVDIWIYHSATLNLRLGPVSSRVTFPCSSVITPGSYDEIILASLPHWRS